ncbi:MAG: hypothetical protein AAF657_36205, partial [Acidobacteriota bacterium]
YLARATFLTLLASLVCHPFAASATGGPLEVRVVYEGPGKVDEHHGLLVFVFGANDFGNPTNPIVATRYLTANHSTARFTDLAVDRVWLMAVYDEAGGYTTGPLPGPFGLYSEAPGGPPAAVQVGGDGIELRFDDTNRSPAPAEEKPRASIESLLGAENGIVEIRIYRTRPGMREEFIRFFEDTLGDQAAAGLQVRGQFRSLDDENTFVWIRSFRNQKERQEQSRAFYLGPAWMEARRAEAAKYLTGGEVLLVEPTCRSSLR